MSGFTWRKLLLSPPPEWQRLALLTRGVGDELLRALDANNEIDCGAEDAIGVVCRITGAHPKERRRVREAIEELEREGFIDLVSEGGRNLIRGHLPDVAPGRRRAREAPRTSTSRASDVHQPCTSEDGAVPGACPERAHTPPASGPNPAQLLNTDPVEKRREEERREEERERARDGVIEVLPALDGRAKRIRGAVVVAYQRLWHADPNRGPWPGPGRAAPDLDAMAQALASRDDGEAYAIRAVEAYFASPDPFVKRIRWSLAHLARDPGRYLERRAPVAGTARSMPSAEAYAASATTDDELAAMGLVAPRTPEERAQAQRVIDDYARGVLRG